MKNKLANMPVPPPPTEADEIRLAIDRLESEAPTHAGQTDDREHDKLVVPSVAESGERHDNSRRFVD